LSGEAHPGVSVHKDSFEAVLKEKAKDHGVYVLEEGGEDLEEVQLDSCPIFVLGDHIGLPKTVESFALRYGEKVSLGKQAYLAASCITILNFIMDKRIGR
jgi:tRNA pseudouridine-54 N-methylase